MSNVPPPTDPLARPSRAPLTPNASPPPRKVIARTPATPAKIAAPAVGTPSAAPAKHAPTPRKAPLRTTPATPADQPVDTRLASRPAAAPRSTIAPPAAPPAVNTSARSGSRSTAARPSVDATEKRAVDDPVDTTAPPWAASIEPIPAITTTNNAKKKQQANVSPGHPADASTRSTRVIEWLTSGLRDPWRERIREYLVLMRMDRPVGALLLLWPTLWGLWFAANDFPPIGTLIIFTVGVFVMRAAGCVINDYADHDWLDANVERTRNRPMAAGRVSKKEALLLFAGLLAFAFILVLFTNALTIKLSFAGAALAAIYPFCKRYTHLAQVVLGAAFGWSIPMAFAAVSGEVPALGWLIFLANVLFSTIYDTEYAMVDREDDIRVGAKSTAILFADADRPIIGVLMLTFLFAMLLAGARAQLVWPYFASLGIAAALFARQQWLIRSRERDACFAAFRNNNWIGFVLWVGLVLALAIR